MEINPLGFIIWFGISSLVYLSGFGFIASKLVRIAKALEEANKQRSQQP
jgi:hypothetical protein